MAPCRCPNLSRSWQNQVIKEADEPSLEDANSEFIDSQAPSLKRCREAAQALIVVTEPHGRFHTAAPEATAAPVASRECQGRPNLAAVQPDAAAMSLSPLPLQADATAT